LALGSVLWLGLGATGLAMVIAYRLLKRVGASRTIVVTYLIPPFALAYGVGLLHEKVDVAAIIAMLLILAGVFLNTATGARASTHEALVELEA
jgi:drug/metabolite transporter (DMT)-like permease